MVAVRVGQPEHGTLLFGRRGVQHTCPLWVGWSEGGPLVLGMMHSGPGGEGGGVGVLGSVTETPTETTRFQPCKIR